MNFESLQNAETEPFSPGQMLEKEKTRLGRFGGRKTLQFAAVLALISGAACNRPPEKVHDAPDSQTRAPIEDTRPVEHSTPRLPMRESFPANENVPTSTPVAEHQATKSELASIDSEAGAELWVLQNYNPLISEFYSGEGHTPSGEAYGVPIFDFSKADMQRMLAAAEKIKAELAELNQRFEVRGFENRKSQLDDMTAKLRHELSPAGELEREQLKRMEEVVGK
jgi:hypothetical protein